jgi:hypothetical protein
LRGGGVFHLLGDLGAPSTLRGGDAGTGARIQVQASRALLDICGRVVFGKGICRKTLFPRLVNGIQLLKGIRLSVVGVVGPPLARYNSLLGVPDALDKAHGNLAQHVGVQLPAPTPRNQFENRISHRVPVVGWMQQQLPGRRGRIRGLVAPRLPSDVALPGSTRSRSRTP